MKLKECPVCMGEPEVEHFKVNERLGEAVTVECSDCGFGEGIAYRDEDEAMEGWNEFVSEFEGGMLSE